MPPSCSHSARMPEHNSQRHQSTVNARPDPSPLWARKTPAKPGCVVAWSKILLFTKRSHPAKASTILPCNRCGSGVNTPKDSTPTIMGSFPSDRINCILLELHICCWTCQDTTMRVFPTNTRSPKHWMVARSEYSWFRARQWNASPILGLSQSKTERSCFRSSLTSSIQVSTMVDSRTLGDLWRKS